MDAQSSLADAFAERFDECLSSTTGAEANPTIV
jgi:hypothetical protein